MSNESFLENYQKSNGKNSFIDNNDEDEDIIVLDEISSSSIKNSSTNLNKTFFKSTPIREAASFTSIKHYLSKKSTSQKSFNSSSQINSDYGSFTNIVCNSKNGDIFNDGDLSSINNDSIRNSFKRKKKLSSSSSEENISRSNYNRTNNQSEDCIILEEINSEESFVLFLRKSQNMNVFALKDKSKHIWAKAILILIKEEEEKYVVKFEKSLKCEKNIIKEYENEIDTNDEIDESHELNENNDISKSNKKKNKKKSFVCSAVNLFEDEEDSIELDGSSVAYSQLGCIELNETSIKLKSRVVSYCKLDIKTKDNKMHLLNANYLCSGTIAELPCKKNNNRYLIFFDNGYVSYAKRNRIFYIFDYLSMPVERLSFDHIYFLKSYFENYPSRSMVQLERNDIITLYHNEKWHDCRVLEVEGALVKLDLQINMFRMEQTLNIKISHSIWFYRGSPKLLPIYDMLVGKISNYDVETKMPTSYEKHLIDKRIRKNIDDEKRDTSIRYHCFTSTLFPENPPEIKQLISITQTTNKIDDKHREDEKPDGKLIYLDVSQDLVNLNIEYTLHECSPDCVNDWEDKNKLRCAINPLLKPILFGWQRQIFIQPKSKTFPSTKWINYMSPCGKTLRSTGEVDRYLYITDSMLTIDMFSFDHFIQTTREFEASSKYLSIDDICDGMETIPISCVNSIDNEKPEHFLYSPVRSAMHGVPLDTDCSKLEGCKCEDNCRDRSKCICWRKTFELTEYSLDREININAGYRGRRLPQFVPTGIFECNSNCKCDHRCSNRVVQNGISVRIQLFKTASKGWGIRCLNDIPKGAFISCYSGQIMNEEQANERNQEYGDTYFAELDFIECMRRLKERYVYKHSSSSDNSDAELNISKNILPRKNAYKVNSQPGVEYICLDSDEDDQDREYKSPNKIGFSESQLLREKKDKELEMSINSNKYFKNFHDQLMSDYNRSEQIHIIDASVCGNIARFLNHSCSPNVFVQNVFVDTHDFRFPWVAFFAANYIKAGTELCWDYGYEIDSVKDKRLNCYCNTSRCRGRLL